MKGMNNNISTNYKFILIIFNCLKAVLLEWF